MGRLWKVGILRDKLFSAKLKYAKEEMLKIEDGISPVREAPSILNTSSLERFPNSAEILNKHNKKTSFVVCRSWFNPTC